MYNKIKFSGKMKFDMNLLPKEHSVLSNGLKAVTCCLVNFNAKIC